MGSTERFFEAIDEGDVDRVRSMVSAEPGLASARDAQGVSALMRARYRLDTALLDAVMRASPFRSPIRPRSSRARSSRRR